MSLKQSIQTLADEFAVSVLAAIRSASLEEILSDGEASTPRGRPAKASESEEAAPKKAKKKGRLARRSPEDIEAAIVTILDCVKNHSDGIGAEAIRKELGIDKKEIGTPIAMALDSGRLRKEGQKRSTLYFVGKKGSGAVKPAKKAAKKAPKRVVKAKAAPKAKAKRVVKAKAKAASKGKKVSKANGAATHAGSPPASESSAEATE